MSQELADLWSASRRSWFEMSWKWTNNKLHIPETINKSWCSKNQPDTYSKRSQHNRTVLWIKISIHHSLQNDFFTIHLRKFDLQEIANWHLKKTNLSIAYNSRSIIVLFWHWPLHEVSLRDLNHISWLRITFIVREVNGKWTTLWEGKTKVFLCEPKTIFLLFKLRDPDFKLF